MPGYDTVVAHRAATFDGSLAWEKHSVTTLPQSVLERHIAHVGEHVTVQHSARLDGAGDPVYSLLSVQASLPKVLRGENVGELADPSLVARAVEQVEADLTAFLGETADLWTWRLQRLDVTCNRDVGRQALVLGALPRLARVRYRGRLPVRGEAQSVTWVGKKGGYTRRAYDKLTESGLPIASGILRGEVAANGQVAIRRAWQTRRDVVVADLLTKEANQARQRTVRWLEEVMERAAGDIPMELAEAIEKLQATTKRPSNVARLLGYAVLVQLAGGEYPVKSGMLTRQGDWKVRREFQAAGVDPFEIEFPDKPDDLAGIVEDELDEMEGDPVGFVVEGMDAIAELDGEAIAGPADLIERATGEGDQLQAAIERDAKRRRHKTG